MPSKAKFKQSTLVHSMHLIFKMQGFPKLICSSFLISSCISVACAQEQVSDLSKNETIEQPTTTVDSDTVQETTMFNTQLVNALPSSNINVQDSLDALKQQEQSVNQINELKPIQLDDNLEDLPTVTVDQNMADEIFRVAEEAKNDAKNYRDNPTKTSDVLVNDASQAELTEITKAPVNIDQLMQEIQTDSKIVVEAN